MTTALTILAVAAIFSPAVPWLFFARPEPWDFEPNDLMAFHRWQRG